MEYRINKLKLSDAYKYTHWVQYPKDTKTIYSYFESRGGEFDNTVFFGLQYLLIQYLEGQFFTQEDLDEAEPFINSIFGQNFFNRKGWQHILDKHNGHLPVRIKAAPEGLPIEKRNVLITMENTDPEVPWLTNWLETMLVQCWYPITVATLSREIKKIIYKAAEETGSDVNNPFWLNDFGFRGVSSIESAGWGDMAHLVNFAGTDTVIGIDFAKHFYDATGLIGASVMATEHSTTTSWGREFEGDFYRNLLDNTPDDAIVSVVIDSFDALAAVSFFGTELKEKVLSRTAPVVFRPDSGVPWEMIVDVLQTAWAHFGGTTNDKGYAVLNPSVRVIYGDGINYESIGRILDSVIKAGYAIENICFGMGGALLQQLNRDTHKFAFKCSAIDRNGVWHDVYKDPITDTGKRSKRGRLGLVRSGDEFKTVAEREAYPDPFISLDVLELVFENGKVVKKYTFDEVRANAVV
jgi:nicotinamide phosphoribosyltransferase